MKINKTKSQSHNYKDLFLLVQYYYKNGVYCFEIPLPERSKMGPNYASFTVKKVNIGSSARSTTINIRNFTFHTHFCPRETEKLPTICTHCELWKVCRLRSYVCFSNIFCTYIPNWLCSVEWWFFCCWQLYAFCTHFFINVCGGNTQHSAHILWYAALYRFVSFSNIFHQFTHSSVSLATLY